MAPQILLETQTFGNYQYERFEFVSKILGNRTMPFSRLRPRGKTDAQIEGTFYLFHGSRADDRQIREFRVPQLVDATIGSAQPALQFVFPSIESSGLVGKWEHYFLEEILPRVESGTATQDSSRLIGGISLGGESALSLFFRFPERFAGAAGEASTLIAFDHLDPEQLSRFFARMKVEEPYRTVMREDLRGTFPTREIFLQHDPIALASRIDLARLKDKPIWLDVGTADEFGLTEGNRQLHETLVARGVPHRYTEVKDGHHHPDYILKNLPALLEHFLRPTQPPRRPPLSPPEFRPPPRSP